MTGHTLRMATLEDAQGVLDIYGPVVLETAISFEWDVPSVLEMKERIAKVLADGFPWVIAEYRGRVGGYAYGSSFRTRTAYSWTAESSVYVHPAFHRQGIGRAVYAALLQLLELQGYNSVYGIATAPNPSSEGLHRSLGFTHVGRFPRVGYKFGLWHDVICWHRALAPPSGAPERVRGVQGVVRDEALSNALPSGRWTHGT